MRPHKYDQRIDLSVDNAHSWVIRRVGTGKRVLEVGCATGRMSQVLVEQFGCTVVGVEIDPAAASEAVRFCHRIIIADLDMIDLAHELGPERFDVIVAADVLEHLRSPERLLAALRPFLVPSGYVVASVPNIGHASIIAELLDGRFTYRPLGLLDETHLRFFTRKSICECFEYAGFGVSSVERLEVEPAETEFHTDLGRFPRRVVEAIRAHEDSLTYQFVLTAHPKVDRDATVVDLPREVAYRREAERLLEELLPQFRALQEERDTQNRAIGDLGVQLNAHRLDLQRRDDEIQELRARLVAITSSAGWKLVEILRRLRMLIIPPNSPMERAYLGLLHRLVLGARARPDFHTSTGASRVAVERRIAVRQRSRTRPAADKPTIGFLTERMLLGFGVDLVIHKTAEGLAARGYKVIVFASTTDGTFDNDSYEIVGLGVPASSFFPSFERNAFRYLRTIQRYDVDIFFIETFPFFALGPSLGRPFVAVDYGVSSSTGFPLWFKAQFAYMRLTQHHLYYPKASRVVTISGFLKKQLPRRVQRRTQIIHPGADHYPITDDLHEQAATVRKRFGVSDVQLLLLYVGRLNPTGQPYKGTARIVQSVQRLRSEGTPIQLLMVGRGSEEDEAWLARAGVHCWRSAPPEAMAGIYTAADLYVTASEWEGFNMPLVEAQYFGKPVVALDVAAHPEVVQNGETGFLVHDFDAFTTVIQRLSGDPGLRRRMGVKAQEWATRFSWATAVEQYDRLIVEIVEETRWRR